MENLLRFRNLQFKLENYLFKWNNAEPTKVGPIFVVCSFLKMACIFEKKKKSDYSSPQYAIPLYNVKKLQRKCCNRTPDLVYLVKFCRTIKRRECPQISYADENKN